MSKKLKLAAGFIGLATIATTLSPALAESGYHGKRHGMRDGGPRANLEERFKAADTDDDGSVTFEEFAAAMEGPLANADGDSDGTITVEEAVAAIQKRQEERMRQRAERIINRFDSDNDGTLTVEELNASRERLFARLDRDNDGKLEAGEMPRRGHHRGERGGRRGDHGMRGGEQMKRPPMGENGPADRPEQPPAPKPAE
ncbi:EF-hand domain-containing protein [Notoacmeibacter sp. MSK16QG-6]|uniref:EF-hand domain-containing protein n=1 Tax=Notoacmeibacter sp. MSK16QG-6 TaxID=2957982 RepID=UPI0020A18162|nr:EF-hand domain-containing protein [Notoacmeibacter sp. MSK16QG-6]MCP1198110.1 EF-hand domain-containing protein [Notoacmeibacter sp. MSK16QG-6]